MNDVRKAAGALLAVLLLAGCTATEARPRAAQTPDRTPTTSTPSPTPTTPMTPTASPKPVPVAAPGATGVKVRELQARLTQLDWLTPPTTGRYDGATTTAVQGFQAKRGLSATGVVDQRTWRRLVRMTVTPSKAELFDEPGPTLFGPGDDGREVREIQARLRQIGWYFGDVTDHYGDQAASAVKGFQQKRRIAATGNVDQRTLDLLEGLTHEPTADELANVEPDPAEGAPLDPRCTTGRALCVDKTSRSLRWVVDGTVRISLDVRFGSEYTPTREGLFHVYLKDADHVSKLYGSAMPYSMFFSGGQAVHYSSDFAAVGYAGASHGCINVRDYGAIASLFAQVAVGDKVVVYRS